MAWLGTEPPPELRIGRALVGEADESYLSPPERTLVQGATLRRRREFVAGRVALSRALEGQHSRATSITHGARFAFAAAGPMSRLGIDLCEWSQAPRLRKIAARFGAGSIEDDVSRLAWWARKEAALKAAGQGLIALFGEWTAPGDLRFAVAVRFEGVLAIAWA